MYSNELKITFNGVVLNDFITPSFSTDSAMLPETADTTLSFLGTIGEIFRQRKYGKRTITIPYTMRNPTESKRQALIAALSVSEPKKLVLSRAPDRYYNAIPKNSTFAIAGYKTTGTLEFECYDGIAHSFDKLPTTGTSGEPITVTNSGTAPTVPILTATMTGDNGLVAWTNDKGGALQFGSPDELDGVTKQKSERPLSVSYAAEPTGVIYNQAATNYPNYLGDASRPNKQQGRIDYKVDYTGGQSAVPYFANGNTGDWGGPSIYLPVTANSAGDNTGNFICRTLFYFESSVTKQGRLEVTLQNGTESAYQFVIRDSSASEEQYKCELWVRDKVYAGFSLTKAQVGKGGYKQVTISKLGSVIQFEIGHVAQVQAGTTNGLDRSVIRSFTLDTVADLPVDGYSAWFERYRDKEHVLMAVADTRFDWVNVDYWSDLPNRFMAGDVVTADVGQKRVYVNGIEDATLQTVGNQWDSFVLPAGETIIQPVASEWADPFQAQIEYREAWY
ncbi:distal tail protein Dit [Lacticaseibacillus absianus]|uniref:distal tail protein Dit n=1 Tax=Lacticaseibacillus absianus TaxID=2729623 RepID=UPI0015CA4C97|nr:distal tail protein Dit [Lacticaseibacillus absianus]